MKKRLKGLVAMLLVTVTIMTSTSLGVLAEPLNQASAEQTSEHSVSFKGLSNLKVNENITYTVTDENGQPATVGIECVAASARAGWTEWKVWYTGLTVNAHFYMKVSNNKVTSVYDPWILTIGGTYSDDSLTRTSTYGKLSFKVEAYASLAAMSCWLKGTVTGSNDDIGVTWCM